MIGRALALLLFSLTFAAPALAQPPEPTPQPPPPVRSAIDENGVDVTRGFFTYDQPGVSIGPAFPHGLSFANRDSGAGTTPGVISSLQASGSTYVVAVGGESDSFTLSGSTYTPTEANGSSLTFAGGIYSYTTRSGVVATFNENVSSLPYWGQGIARPFRVIFPDGTRILYSFKTLQYCPDGVENGMCPYDGGYRYALRLQSITNNHGYQLKLSYASNTLNDLLAGSHYDDWTRLISVTAINNAVDYCDPGADTCSLSQSWPTLTFGTSSAGATITVGGETTTYTGAGIRLPGSTTDDISVATNSNGEVTSVTQFGVTHNYAVTTTSTERTTTVTDPLNATRVYVTELANLRLKSFTDELGRTTGYQYDTNGRLTRVTAHLGNYTQYTYDLNGGVTRGNIVETRQVAQSGSGLPDIVTTADYDPTCANPVKCNRPNFTIDARSYRTTYTYDATHGGVTSVTGVDPATGAVCTSTSGVCPQTRTTYDTRQAYYHQTSSGGPSASGTNIHVPIQISSCTAGNASSCVSTGNEVRTTIGWGPQTSGTANNLLPTSTTSGDGGGNLSATATASYDAIGNLVTLNGPLTGEDDTTTFRYDALRRRVGVISPDPDGPTSGTTGTMLRRAQRTTIAATGLVSQVDQGTVEGTTDANWAAFATLQSVALTYDTRRRVIRQRLLSSSASVEAVRDFEYDGFNRVECAATRMDSSLWGPLTDGCDLQDTTPGIANPDRIQRTLYTLAGELYQQQAAYRINGQAAIVSTNSYTLNGRLASLTDANGNVSTYTYDGHDRLRRTCYAETASSGCATATGTGFEQLTYETTSSGTRTSGLIASRLLRDGRSIAYTHDPLGRLTLKDVPTGGYWDYDISYTYDLLGRRLSASDYWTTSTDAHWQWDALGRMTGEDSGFGWNTRSYDLAGRLTRHAWPDGFAIDYDHLITGEVTAIRENGSTQTTCNGQIYCVLATFGYDDLGRRTSLTRGNGSATTYQYNAASQLSQIADSIPCTSCSQALSLIYNRAGQITQRGSNNSNYSYLGRTNGTVTDSINALNQITQTGSTTVSHDANGNTSAIGLATYTYTSENRLATAPNGIYLPYWASGLLWEIYESPAGTETMFEYLSGNMISEYDSARTLTRRYVRGPGVDEVLVEYQGAGTATRRFLHADERGSIVAISNSAGTVTHVNSYDEYGVPAAGNEGRFQYTGQPWIAQVGMYYYRARFYNPHLGRFMQTDPIGFEGGVNLYSYVGGDPVNLSDPSGLYANDRPCITGGPFVCPPIDVIGTRSSPPAGMLAGVISRGSGNRSGEVGPGSGNSWQSPDDVPPPCDPPGTRFDTRVEAGVAGSRYSEAMRRAQGSPNIETGGGIVPAPQGGWTFSPSPIRGTRATAPIPRSYLVGGWYHNHLPDGGDMLAFGETHGDVRDGDISLSYTRTDREFVTVLGRVGRGDVQSWIGGTRLRLPGHDEGSIRCQLPSGN